MKQKLILVICFCLLGSTAMAAGFYDTVLVDGNGKVPNEQSAASVFADYFWVGYSQYIDPALGIDNAGKLAAELTKYIQHENFHTQGWNRNAENHYDFATKLDDWDFALLNDSSSKQWMIVADNNNQWLSNGDVDLTKGDDILTVSEANSQKYTQAFFLQGGIINLPFNQTAPSVPEPGSILLLGTGLLGLGLLGKRKLTKKQ